MLLDIAKIVSEVLRKIKILFQYNAKKSSTGKFKQIFSSNQGKIGRREGRVLL